MSEWRMHCCIMMHLYEWLTHCMALSFQCVQRLRSGRPGCLDQCGIVLESNTTSGRGLSTSAACVGTSLTCCRYLWKFGAKVEVKSWFYRY